MKAIFVAVLLVLSSHVLLAAGSIRYIQYCRSDLDCRWNMFGHRYCLGWECERYYQMTPCSKDSDCVGSRGGRVCRNMYCRNSRTGR